MIREHPVYPDISQYKELTEQIIQCAVRVYDKLGFGFLESVYGKALMIELHRAGLTAKSQIGINVHYDGIIVGEFVADLLVEKVVLIELKSVRTLAKVHEVQLVNYLTATGKPIGILINFGEYGVEVRRRALRAPSGQAVCRRT